MFRPTFIFVLVFSCAVLSGLGSITDEEVKLLEQSHVSSTRHGLMSIAPVHGPTKGGNLVLFIYAFEDGTTKGLGEGFFSECTFGDIKTKVTKHVLYDAANVLFVYCVAPQQQAGEVRVSLNVNGTDRYPDYGAVTYKYTDHEEREVVPLAIATTFRNQARYIREWVAYHTIFGVSRFYLYDQGSTDNWREEISDFIESGLVVPQDWYFDWLKPSIRHQSSGFWHCLKNYGQEVDWIAFIDMDEFLLMPKNNETDATPSIAEFLRDFADFGGVMIDRFNFGPNGHVTRPKGLVIESYTTRTGNSPSAQSVKSIVQPRHVVWAGCGGVHTFRMPKDHPSVDAMARTRSSSCGAPYENFVTTPIRINHYFTKSLEDWEERFQWDSNPYKITADKLETWKYFNFVDEDIFVYVDETKKRMGRQ